MTVEKIVQTELEEQNVTERNISIGDIFQQTNQALLQQASEFELEYRMFEFPKLLDIFFDEMSKGMFAIVSDKGRLYKVRISANDGRVVLLDAAMIMMPQQIEQNTEYSTPDNSTVSYSGAPVNFSFGRSTISVMRQANGLYRFFTIAGTAILNRVAEIDSTSLFDNFIKHIDDGDAAYPYLTFFHLGEKMRMGQVDWLGRDGVVLMASGTFDNTQLGEYAIKALQREPDYWGISIGYRMSERGIGLELIAEDVIVPVIEDGILRELSLLPEKDAASWFTKNIIPMEVTRMKGNILDAIKRFVGGDQAAADEIVKLVDSVNERAVSDGLITRATDAEQVESVAEETKVETPAVVDEATERSTETKAEDVEEIVIEREIELDDIVMTQIVDAVIEKTGVQDVLESIGTVVTEMEKVRAAVTEDATAKTDLASKVDALTSAIASIKSRLDALEKPEAAKKREYVNDLPSRRKVTVTYRASQDADADVERSATKSYDEISRETLSRLHK